MNVVVQYASAAEGLPVPEEIQGWVEAALSGRRDRGELTVRIVDAPEGAELNKRYRGRAAPTNVLSFPFDGVPGVELPLLGDIVICAPVVLREAREQDKPQSAHWAHMVVHGLLHLLGYDHEEPGQARVMERLEKDVLGKLGFPDPYGDEKTS